MLSDKPLYQHHCKECKFIYVDQYYAIHPTGEPGVDCYACECGNTGVKFLRRSNNRPPSTGLGREGQHILYNYKTDKNPSNTAYYRMYKEWERQKLLKSIKEGIIEWKRKFPE